MKKNKLMFLPVFFISLITQNTLADNFINLDKIVATPENIMSLSYGDILSTYEAFENENNRQSYLKHIVNSYRDSYTKDGKSISIMGRDGSIYYFVEINSERSFDKNDDLGLRSLVCKSEINKLFLTLGVEFQIRVTNGGQIIHKKAITNKDEYSCLVEVKKPVSKAIIKEESKKAMTTPVVENNTELKKIDENQIKDTKLLPPISMPGEEPKKKNIPQIIDLNTKKSTKEIKEQKQIPKKEIIQEVKKPIEYSEKEKELLNDTNFKIVEDLVKKRGDDSINQKKIEVLAEKIKKDYQSKSESEKKEYKKTVIEFIKVNYGKFLNKEIQKGISLNVDTNKENVNFNIKFNKEAYKLAEKEINNWSTTNEAKEFVCSQVFLKEMLDIGISFNVKYFSDKNNLVFLENIKGDKSSCFWF